ncbi:glycoside hydrolase [Arachidicoccus ginsenosidimutans]|uniref:glycoside hydrolase family 28 protein n=1 Tax=Arachidicoccus sp. BS20 TaxID=1850526 RepID=UPI0007F06212|nr:glycoside hydrolase family 28 protein [Arachidicoccus sp. BS20]ANI89634.1 glycoside hydrolase [Arachidicoccus sp. BS20]
MKNLRFIFSIIIFSVCTFYTLCGNLLLAQSKQYNISDYGAVGDGTTLNTETIQSVIDKAGTDGGGTVIIPAGKFLTGMLVMKSNVELHLEKDAVLLGSTNPFDYHTIDMKELPESPKKDDNSPLALLIAYRADNVSITGSGTIDGQGTQLALNIDSLYHLGLIKDPNYSSWGNRPNEKVRPKLFLFALCKNVNIEDATLKSPACWGLSFELCNHLTLNKIHIVNRAFWNNDGTDITDCRNVRITNCNINSADDGICLKSYYPGYCDDSFYISNCTIRSGASAIKFGTASFGGFKNITIDNIKVFDTYRSALAIESVDGGDIENIKATNITAVNTGNAIFIRLGNRVRKEPGQIKNVYIGNVKVQIPFGRPDIDYDLRAEEPAYHNPFASSITGIPNRDVKDITLENIEITYPGRASKAQAYFPLWRLKDFPEKINSYPEFSMFGEMPSWGFYVRHAEGITLKNIVLKLDNDDFRPAFVFDDVKEIDMDKITLPSDYQNNQIVVKDCKEIQLKESGQISVKEIQ